MNRILLGAACFLLACMPFPARAQAPAVTFDYGLTPKQIARDTWVFSGTKEDFQLRNGGNILNTAFIVTDGGVIVIDTGPSKAYGEQMRRAIAKVTEKPVKWVFNTHSHPDHFLGNQAYADVSIRATDATVREIQSSGAAFADNMYRLLLDWMKGTEPVVPKQTVRAGPLALGDHQLRLLVLSGHTGEDLVVLDESTGVLFAGDLVFLDRTPTTPHADIARWRHSLQTLRELPFRTVVPGHGPVHEGNAGIAQTDRYLTWLDGYLSSSARLGLDMSELPDSRVPAEWRALAVFRDEFQRTLAHLYPTYERSALR